MKLRTTPHQDVFRVVYEVSFFIYSLENYHIPTMGQAQGYAPEIPQ